MVPENTKLQQKTEALEHLITEFQDQLFRFAFFRTGSAADAQDIVQNVFIRLFDKRNDLSEVRDIKSYLFRSVANSCCDLQRKQRKNRLVPLGTEVARITESDETEAVREYERIDELLSDIPYEQAEIIRMKTICDLKFTEISDILHLPLTTVKSRFKYGIDKIKAKIN